MADNVNGWTEWSKYVLKELERLNECYEKLDDKMKQLLIDHESLKTKFEIKSGVWGLLGGLIPAAAALIYFIMQRLR